MRLSSVIYLDIVYAHKCVRIRQQDKEETASKAPMQDALPSLSRNWPMEQAMHWPLPSTEYWPVAHWVQLVEAVALHPSEPTVAEACPGAHLHGLHAVWPLMLSYWPAKHSMQDVVEVWCW